MGKSPQATSTWRTSQRRLEPMKRSPTGSWIDEEVLQLLRATALDSIQAGADVALQSPAFGGAMGPACIAECVELRITTPCGFCKNRCHQKVSLHQCCHCVAGRQAYPGNLRSINEVGVVDKYAVSTIQLHVKRSNARRSSPGRSTVMKPVGHRSNVYPRNQSPLGACSRSSPGRQ